MSPFSPADSVIASDRSASSPARKQNIKLTCIKLLGRGGHAEVYLARDKNEALRYVPYSFDFV
jgi:hypothetical protein